MDDVTPPPSPADARARLGARDSTVLEALVPGEAVLDARSFVPSPRGPGGRRPIDLAFVVVAAVLVAACLLAIGFTYLGVIVLSPLIGAVLGVAELGFRVRRRRTVEGAATHLTGTGFAALTEGRLLVFSSAKTMPTQLRHAFALRDVRVSATDPHAKRQEVTVRCADGSSWVVRFIGRPAETRPFAQRVQDAIAAASARPGEVG